MVRKGLIIAALILPCTGVARTYETSRPAVKLWSRPNSSPCVLSREKLQRLGEFALSGCQRLVDVCRPQNSNTDLLALFV
jgi:hypothetical protein